MTDEKARALHKAIQWYFRSFEINGRMEKGYYHIPISEFNSLKRLVYQTFDELPPSEQDRLRGFVGEKK